MTLVRSHRLHIGLAVAGLALAALALMACAKDPTEGKTKAAVGEARAAAPISAAAQTLRVTPTGSSLSFVGAKVTAQHVGVFGDFAGTISLVDGKPEQSRVEFEVQVASMVVDDGNDKLAGHLKSADFFDVEKFPTARFVSTEIRPGSDVAGMNYTVTGNLTLRGTTKSITFPADITVSADAVKVKSQFGIDRKDFGIVYPGMPDDLIRDNVLIRVELNAARAQQS